MDSKFKVGDRVREVGREKVGFILKDKSVLGWNGTLGVTECVGHNGNGQTSMVYHQKGVWFYSDRELELVPFQPSTTVIVRAIKDCENGKVHRPEDGRWYAKGDLFEARQYRHFENQWNLYGLHRKGYATLWGNFYKSDFEVVREVKPEAKPEFSKGDLVVYTLGGSRFFGRVEGIGVPRRWENDAPTYSITFALGSLSAPQDQRQDMCRKPTADELATKFDLFKPAPAVTKAEASPSRKQVHIVVLMDCLGNLQPSRRPYVHPTKAGAEIEAKRLAETTKVDAGSTFVVLSAVSKAVPPVPTKAALVAF